MASASGIKAGSAYIELLVKDSQLVKGLAAAGKKLKAFGTAISSLGTRLMALGTLVTAPLAAMAKGFADSGSRLYEMVKRTGISAESLSELGYAAQKTGTDLESLEGGVRKMQKSIFAAARGSGAAAQALATLGLDIRSLSQMNPEQQFKAIADALAGVSDPTMRAALAMQIFGRNGTALLPLMEKGAAGIEAYQKQARALGLTSSSESVAAAKALSDAFTDFARVSKKTASILGSAVADTLRQTTVWMTQLIVKLNAFIKSHKDVVVAVFKVAKVVFAVGLGLVVLGTIIAKIGAGFGLLATIITKAAGVLGVIGGLFLWLVSPIGLVITAVAALGAYLIYTSGVGTKALAWLAERFIVLKDEALAAFGGISDALAAGDLGLAARILWLTLKLEWDKGIAALEPAWLSFKLFFLKVAYGAFYGALAAWEMVQNALSVAWIETTAFISRTWTGFTSLVQSSWETVQNWLEKRWHDLFALFDDTYDAGAAKAMADRLSQEAQQRIEQEKQKALGQTEQDRQAKRSEAARQHGQAMGQIGGEYEKAIADTASANAAKVKAAQEAVEKARAEWQAAIEEAKKKRQAHGGAGGAGNPEMPPPPQQRFTGLADVLDQAQKRTIGVAGSFNAMEARGLGAGGVADRIAQAAEQTAKNTKQMLDELQDMDGAEFE